MKTTAVLLAAIGLALLSLPADAQRVRQRANPFADFHKIDGLALDKPAPALHLKDSDGKEANLRDYLGRWVFIEFGSYT